MTLERVCPAPLVLSSPAIVGAERHVPIVIAGVKGNKRRGVLLFLAYSSFDARPLVEAS